MINFLALLLTFAVLLLSLVQTVLVAKYYWFHHAGRNEPPFRPSAKVPSKAAIILCLRGYEESVPECLAGLIGQDYPDFELHIAFDSKNDPAFEQVEGFFEGGREGVYLHFFEPQSSCSYKCSGIIHVVERLNNDIEIVAFCDGDTLVDENWLTKLATPLLADKTIGVTTGNRWFAPYDKGIGGLIRKQWNAAAVVQMQAYDIAWGGSMATRRSVIRDCDLTEVWARSFCEDTSISDPLKKHGLRLHRIPDLIVVNREATTIKNCVPWISRQLLTARLHHPLWKFVKAHGIATLVVLAAPIVMVLLFKSGYMIAGRRLLFAWLIYQFVNIALLWVIKYCNSKALASAQDDGSNSGSAGQDGDIFGMLLVQLVYPLAFTSAWFANSVSWRGIKYLISERQSSSEHAAVTVISD